MVEVALHGGGAQAFPAAQYAAVNAVAVQTVDSLPISFVGSLALQNAREALAMLPMTLTALPFPARENEQAGAPSQVVVAHLPLVGSFAALLVSAAVRAGHRTHVLDVDVDPALVLAHPGNLVVG